MIKYVPELTSVVLEEIPDRVTLAVEISNCRGNCPGCHSPFLKEDIGEELTPAVIDALVADNFGVDCFLFLGEGRDPEAICALAAHVRSLGLLAAVYSGRPEVDDAIWAAFDYVKVGPYVEALGPLNKPTTNQRLYRALRPEDADSAVAIKPGLSQSAVSPEIYPAAAPSKLPSAAAVPEVSLHYFAGRPFQDITARFWHRGLDARRSSG